MTTESNEWDTPPAGNTPEDKTAAAKPSAKTATNAKTATKATPKPKKAASRRSGNDENEEDIKYVDLLTSKDDTDDSEIIKLFQNDEIPPNGQPFGVNGRFFALKANVWYRVPGWLLSTIDNSIHEKPVADDNNRFIGTRPQPRFPYTVHRG